MNRPVSLKEQFYRRISFRDSQPVKILEKLFTKKKSSNFFLSSFLNKIDLIKFSLSLSLQPHLLQIKKCFKVLIAIRVAGNPRPTTSTRCAVPSASRINGEIRRAGRRTPHRTKNRNSPVSVRARWPAVRTPPHRPARATTSPRTARPPVSWPAISRPLRTTHSPSQMHRVCPESYR